MWVSVEFIRKLAEEQRQQLWKMARAIGREHPKIYLHWTAGNYNTVYNSYHICITGDGDIYIPSGDLTQVRAHTSCRNTAGIGVALCCCFDATSNSIGTCPPTVAQIETMAQVIAALCDGLWLTPNDKHCVMTHGEAADNIDGIYADDPYGVQNGCERWDLQFLGTDESPRFLLDYEDPRTGGNVLRGKAMYYLNKWEKGE